jgi:2'-5' RNA ligase
LSANDTGYLTFRFVKRLFFALTIPPGTRELLLGAFPQKKHFGIRFTPTENLHITAHFLGATAEDKLKERIGKTETLAALSPPFHLKFEQFKIISKEKRAVMIWAQFEKEPLYESLCIELRRLFPTDENRKPVPHATIARIKQLRELPFELPQVKSFSMEITSLALWESQLDPSGARYEMIAEWKLKGSLSSR